MDSVRKSYSPPNNAVKAEASIPGALATSPGPARRIADTPSPRPPPFPRKRQFMLGVLALIIALAIMNSACADSTSGTPAEPAASPGDGMSTFSTAQPTTTPNSTTRVETPRLTLEDERLREALLRTLHEAPDITADASIDGFLPPGLDLVRLTRDPQYAPMLVDMLGIPPYGGVYRRYLGDTLEYLTGEDIGTDWFEWIQWVSEHPELGSSPLYAWWKGELLSTLDPRFREFLPADGVEHDIRLEEIVWGGVRVDGIPSLDDPQAIDAYEARYLEVDEQVFGVTFNGESRAYPLRIMNWHEMTNDVVGDVPFSLAYCTLCGSGILFDTRGPDGEAPYRFGSSGLLYRSNKLMYDAETRSLWNQFTGRPVVGPLVGQDITLSILPVTLTTWGEWNAQHPDTTVLSLKTGYERDYNKPGAPGAAYNDYFASPGLLFPGGPRTGEYTLRPKSQVYVAMSPEGESKAYPLDILRGQSVLNDAIGELPIVVLTDAGGGAQAFRRDDNIFSRADDGALQDQQGSSWSVTPSGLTGPEDQDLSRLSGHVAYWFAYATFRPDGMVYVGE